MRPLERVQRTRRALAVAVVSRAMLLAVAAGSLAATATLFAARTSGAAGSALPWLAAIVVGGAVAAVAMRGWVRLTVPRVALWVEERVPSLEYALVTAVDPAGVGSNQPLLERAIDGVSWARETRHAIAKALAWPT